MTDKDKVKDEDIIRVLIKKHDTGAGTVIDTLRNKPVKKSKSDSRDDDPASILKRLDDKIDERNKDIMKEIMSDISDEDFVEIFKGNLVTPKEKKVKDNEKEIYEATEGTEFSEVIESTFAEARFEEDDNVIRNVALLGKISKNNRIYSDLALNDVVGLANGVKVFADHPKKGETVRSVKDVIGAVEHPHLMNGKVYGNLRVLSSHKNWVFALAKETPNLVGMSILAKGKVKSERDDKGREQIESVTALASIDLVSSPASTSGMMEQTLGVKKDGKIGGVRVGNKFDPSAPVCPLTQKVLCPVYSELDKKYENCKLFKGGENCPYSPGGAFYVFYSKEEISDDEFINKVKDE